MPNLYGNLLFTRDWTYEPFTVTNIRTGRVVGKVLEISKTHVNGLGSSNSLYGVLSAEGKLTFPYMTWTDLLDKLDS